ncbi:siderophore synthetase component [Paenibacillus shirakamiensis]|uniref:Siderophore synthetase component n=1 Tax=Paenibacillus shirakamiensis TaxID=1265935 RepID=A0ABS4JE16_9BACL|nr:IucA/IucC family protein [Paenibacillus shirakamiensis]MBP1999967.1 siderophore synthetase component [Paenibacillus shirakamiensis]
MNDVIATLVMSEEWVQVRRRIFRQLIESLLYEQILSIPIVESKAASTYVIHGHSHTGAKVKYTFYAMHKLSFDRIRLTETPVMRITSEEETEADSIPQFLQEIACCLPTSEPQLAQFIAELQQTHLKDTLSLRWNNHQEDPDMSDYDEWESTLIEGHPYHPCYKSRMGFTLADNKRYGPEFSPEFTLVWIALHQDVAKISLSTSLGTYSQFVQQQLGEEWELLMSKLPQLASREVPYVLLPVHPWQWEQHIALLCTDQIRKGEIIYLGRAGDSYRPQQSIRTMTNVTNRDKPYVKLPLNIVNTSSGRILAGHTIINAARISDWLGHIVTEDTYLQELELIVLKEMVGVTYDLPQFPNLFEQQMYGSLGTIWRESLHPYLHAEEHALPFAACSHVNKRGIPLIEPWICKYGLDIWTTSLLRVVIVPLVHLLYAHGAALESHAQNMIIVMKQGWPVRLALKDFHDGIRYCPWALHSNEYPQIEYPPPNHQKVNRNSFIEKEDPKEVKDFLLDALMFINLTDLAWFMEKHFGLHESRWWDIAVKIIKDYQAHFPNLGERFDHFQVFSPEVEVEKLTYRRLDENPDDCVHRVRNPLYVVMNESRKE